MSDEKRTSRHLCIYYSMNAVVIGFLVAGFLMTAIGGAKQEMSLELQKIGYYFSYAGTLFTCAMFIDTLRRMETVIKLIPGLKKSEYFWKLLFIKYSIFLASETFLLIEVEKIILRA